MGKQNQIFFIEAKLMPTLLEVLTGESLRKHKFGLLIILNKRI